METVRDIRWQEIADVPAQRREYALDLATAIRRATDRALPDDMPVMDAACVRLLECADPSNIWLAKDLHREDTGDLYHGHGRLWRCHSKLCPDCTAYNARRCRRKLTLSLDNQKLWTNEQYYFLTFTQTNPNLTLLESRALINRAWSLFRKRNYIRRRFVGWAKSEEFTVTENGVHYHIHLIARAKFIQYDLVRKFWTECVSAAWHEQGLTLRVANKDEMLSVTACRLDGSWCIRCAKRHDVRSAVKEVAKYITKATSWLKVSDSDLLDIVRTQRFPRMFELGGTFAHSCDDPARVKTRLAAPAAEPQVSPEQTRHILDTECTTDEVATAHPASWREEVYQFAFWAWKANLAAEIQTVKRTRRIALAKKYPYAQLKTLKEYRQNNG